MLYEHTEVDLPIQKTYILISRKPASLTQLKAHPFDLFLFPWVALICSCSKYTRYVSNKNVESHNFIWKLPSLKNTDNWYVINELIYYQITLITASENPDGDAKAELERRCLLLQQQVHEMEVSIRYYLGGY